MINVTRLAALLNLIFKPSKCASAFPDDGSDDSKVNIDKIGTESNCSFLPHMLPGHGNEENPSSSCASASVLEDREEPDNSSLDGKKRRIFDVDLFDFKQVFSQFYLKAEAILNNFNNKEMDQNPEYFFIIKELFGQLDEIFKYLSDFYKSIDAENQISQSRIQISIDCKILQNLISKFRRILKTSELFVETINSRKDRKNMVSLNEDHKSVLKQLEVIMQLFKTGTNYKRTQKKQRCDSSTQQFLSNSEEFKAESVLKQSTANNICVVNEVSDSNKKDDNGEKMEVDSDVMDDLSVSNHEPVIKNCKYLKYDPSISFKDPLGESVIRGAIENANGELYFALGSFDRKFKLLKLLPGKNNRKAALYGTYLDDRKRPKEFSYYCRSIDFDLAGNIYVLQYPLGYKYSEILIFDSEMNFKKSISGDFINNLLKNKDSEDKSTSFIEDLKIVGGDIYLLDSERAQIIVLTDKLELKYTINLTDKLNTNITTDSRKLKSVFKLIISRSFIYIFTKDTLWVYENRENGSEIPFTDLTDDADFDFVVEYAPNCFISKKTNCSIIHQFTFIKDKKEGFLLKKIRDNFRVDKQVYHGSCPIFKSRDGSIYFILKGEVIELYKFKIAKVK